MIESATGRALGNLRITVRRPNFPRKRFTDEPAAIAWLHEFSPPWSPTAIRLACLFEQVLSNIRCGRAAPRPRRRRG